MIVNGLQMARPDARGQPQAGPARPSAAAAARLTLLNPPLNPDRPGEPLMLSTLLHRAADLRQRPGDRDHADRRGRRSSCCRSSSIPRSPRRRSQVTTTYPGADAKTLSDTVASPIEQEVNGVEGMLYMSSTCASDGSYNLTVTFEVGTNLDMAQVLVQNRVAIAQPRLPQEVQRQGITTKKKSTAIILVVALTSKKDATQYDSLFLSNYATLRVKDVLSRIYGVGDIQVFGSSNYGMRIWLDPEKLKARSLTTLDVLAAIQEQNIQVAAGQVGAPPTPGDQSFQYTVTTQGRLADPEEFGEIIVKTAPGERSRHPAPG